MALTLSFLTSLTMSSIVPVLCNVLLEVRTHDYILIDRSQHAQRTNKEMFSVHVFVSSMQYGGHQCK